MVSFLLVTHCLLIAANARTNPSTVYSEATTSTRSPSSSAVFAVIGPMHATSGPRSVSICPFSIAVRFRTVEDEVNVTMSIAPSRSSDSASAGAVSGTAAR